MATPSGRGLGAGAGPRRRTVSAPAGRWRWPVAARPAPRSGGTTRCPASPAPCAWRCTRARCACPADTCERLRGAGRGPGRRLGPLSLGRERGPGTGTGAAVRLPQPSSFRPSAAGPGSGSSAGGCATASGAAGPPGEGNKNPAAIKQRTLFQLRFLLKDPETGGAELCPTADNAERTELESCPSVREQMPTGCCFIRHN